jgi:DNA-binding NarL/FixJ family response regulator
VLAERRPTMRDAIDETRVTVLRDPDEETVREQLQRGPVVFLGGTPEVIIDIARRTDRAWALLPPDVDQEALKAAIRAVAAGFTVIPPSLTNPVVVGARRPVPRDGSAPPPVESLTARERDVLQHLAEGLPNRAIAEALGISEHTVKFHLASIFGKLGAGTRTKAVRLGLRQGLVTV